MARASAAFNIIFGAKTGQLSKDLKGVQRELTILQRNLQQSGRRLTAGLTAPLVAIGASSFKVAADFEASMARVAAVSGATGASFDRLRNLAQELGRTTVFTASEVAQLQESFARLGFTSTEIEQVTAATLNLAQASGSDLARAADVAGSTLRAFELDASKTGDVTDVMAKSFSTTALDMDAFAESMKLVAPVANSAGLSLEQTTALLGTLSNAGIRGSSAGTALRRIISELGTTSGDVAGEIQKLAEEGLNLADAKDEVGRNAQSALLVLANGVKDTEDLTDAFNDASGSAAEMAGIMNDTAQGSMKRMQSAIEGAQIALGTALAPVVESVADDIAKLAESFSNLSPETQETIVNMGLFAAAIGPVQLALSGLVGGLKNAIKYSKSLIKWIAANPYLAAAAAVAALAYAVADYAGQTDVATEAQKRIDAVSRKAQDNYIQEAAQVQALSEQYKYFQDDLEQREAILNDLQRIVPGYFDDLDAETTKYDQLADAVGSYLDEVKEAAIQKAFGDELVDIEAELLKLEAEKRRISVMQAKNQAQANKMDDSTSGGSIKEGTKVTKTDIQRLANLQQGMIDDLQREIDVLQTEKLGVLENIRLAQSEVNDAVEEEGKKRKKNDDEEQQRNKKRRSTVVTPTEVQPIRYDTDEEAFSRVMEQLGQAENAALAFGELSGDQAGSLEQLGDAYSQAALQAQELLQIDAAAWLQEQADAYYNQAEAIRTSSEAIYKAINENLGDLQNAFNINFTLTGDELGSLQMLADGYRQAAFEAARLGDIDLAKTLYAQGEAWQAQADASRDAAAATKAAADAADATMKQLVDGAAQAIVGVGNAFADANAQYREGMKELNAMFAEGSLTAEEYAEREKFLEKQRKIERAQAASDAIATYTAEAVAALMLSAIKQAAAAGGGGLVLAPILAGAASTLVKGLFSSSIPAFAEGGAVIGGETLALLGDNPSGKEMVIPFEKLPQFLNMFQAKNSSEVVVQGMLHGKDIHLSSVKSTRYVQRTNAAMAF